MELLQLKYFQTIAKFQHLTRAANELNVSQPSLSIMISKIEDELEIPLFDRKGRNIFLNEYGKKFYAHVNTILNELEYAKQELKELKETRNKQVSIAATNAILLKDVLRDFMILNKNCTVRQAISSIQDIEINLFNGRFDFAVTTPPIINKNIESILLLEDNILLVVPSNHRLANRNSIRLEEVAMDPFICMEKGSNYRDLTDNLCRTAGFDPNVIFEGNIQLIYELLQSCRGVALVPKSFCKMYYDPVASYLDIESPTCMRTVNLSYIKNKYLSSTAKKFMQYIINHYKNFYC